MDKLWDEFESKPASSIMPTRETESLQKFDEIEKTIAGLYKIYDTGQYALYKKGHTVSISGDADYTYILINIIKLVIQSVRLEAQKIESEEDRQVKLIQISALETATVDLVKVLKSFNFNLDKNSVAVILHGHINNTVRNIFINHETRRSTQHRHDGTTQPQN